MSIAFAEFQEALKTFSKRVVEASEAINLNRMAHQLAVEKFEQAVVADQPTQELERNIAAVNAEFEILSHRANALNKATGKGGNAFVREAAKKVFQENTREIEGLREVWEAKKKELLTIQNAYLETLVEMGQLARMSSQLREECTLASGEAGLALHVASLGDDLLVSRRKGFIFLDPSEVALAYTSGELPMTPEQKAFAGTVTGVPKEKIRTDSAEPAPARVYRAKPKPVKPAEEAGAEAVEGNSNSQDAA
jgi:hypothetical protein